MKSIILSLAVLSTTAFAESRIRGGDELDPLRYPAVGQIKGGAKTCVGTALDRHKVVTTARCVVGLDTAKLKFDAVTGHFDIREIRIHPDFADTILDTVDIAVVVLSGQGLDLPWYPSVQEDNSDDFGTSLGVSFGEGSAATGNHTGLFNFVRRVWLNQSPGDVHVPVRDGLVFGPGPKQQVPCGGDEGSPLFFGERMIGVLSHPIYSAVGPKECSRSRGGLYTWSRHFMPWYRAMHID